MYFSLVHVNTCWLFLPIYTVPAFNFMTSFGAQILQSILFELSQTVCPREPALSDLTWNQALVTPNSPQKHISFHECVSFRRTNCLRSRETLPRGSFPPRRVLLRLSGESAGVQSHAAAKRLLPQTPCPHSRRLGLPSPPPGVLCPAREAPLVPHVRHREADDASRVGDRRCSKPRVMLGRFSPFSF